MTVHQLKRDAKEIDSRLSIAHYSDHYFELRWYGGPYTTWERKAVCRSADQVRWWLNGFRAARGL